MIGASPVYVIIITKITYRATRNVFLDTRRAIYIYADCLCI